MFSIFKKRQAEPEVRYVTREVYRETADSVRRKKNQEDYIRNAELEYARLNANIGKNLDNRDAGEPYSHYELDRDLGKLTVLSDSIAILIGKDPIAVGATLERKSRELIASGHEFPFNSYLSGSSLIFRSKVEAGIRNDA